MPATRTTVAPIEANNLGWFEREILNHTPYQSILDATSLGVFTIGEQSGRLVGAWKNHRLLMQDLALDEVSAALGALLAAIVQTAHAIDRPLAEVMQQQVERVHLSTLSQARHKNTSRTALRGEEPSPATGLLPMVAATPVGERKKRGRPPRQDKPIALTPVPDTVSPVKRGRPRKVVHATPSV